MARLEVLERTAEGTLQVGHVASLQEQTRCRLRVSARVTRCSREGVRSEGEREDWTLVPRAVPVQTTERGLDEDSVPVPETLQTNPMA